DQVARAVSAAKLVAVVGDPRRAASFRIRGSVLTWPTQTGHEGDWYVDVAPTSPLAERLSGVAWDSLPPLLALGDAPPDSAGFAVLTARLSRRGAPRPLAVVSEAPKGQGSGRRASILGSGLWRWGFRGGASAEAYRALIAALSEWLLGGA